MGHWFAQNSKAIAIRIFIMSLDIFHGFGLERQKPSEFVSVAISNLTSKLKSCI